MTLPSKVTFPWLCNLGRGRCALTCKTLNFRTINGPPQAPTPPNFTHTRSWKIIRPRRDVKIYATTKYTHHTHTPHHTHQTHHTHTPYHIHTHRAHTRTHTHTQRHHIVTHHIVTHHTYTPHIHTPHTHHTQTHTHTHHPHHLNQHVGGKSDPRSLEVAILCQLIKNGGTTSCVGQLFSQISWWRMDFFAKILGERHFL